VKGLRIAFFGSSLVSAYWNGAATYYRGIIRALHARGHRVTFYEPDAFERQEHRDLDDPPWARVVVYSGADELEAERNVRDAAREADVLVKVSDVGVFDAVLEEAVLAYKGPNTRAVFWDVDAPATLDRLKKEPSDPFRELVPYYDMVFTYGGGSPVVARYEALGARCCVPIYNALDPDTHYRTAPDPRFSATLALLANRLSDRERRVEHFFLEPAARLASASFLLGGNGWEDKACPPNVRRVGPVFSADHNAFNATPLAVLNVARASIADCGVSPGSRVFEAAGAGACIITDAWKGMEAFLEPGREVLVAEDGEGVRAHVKDLTPERARAIGDAAMRRVLEQHTYALRAEEVEAALLQHARPDRERPARA
jgi:spore maturation protein CgeB